MNRPSRSPLLIAVANIGLAFVLAACQSGGAGSQPAVASAGTAAVVSVSSSVELGEFLVDPAGRTLYVFLNDSPGTSTCSDECATNWPPATIGADQSPAGIGVTAALGTLARADGSRQLTLDGWPLYRYAGDAGPGEATGEGIGGVWFVARPDGRVASASDAPTAAPSVAPSAEASADGSGTYDPYDY